MFFSNIKKEMKNNLANRTVSNFNDMINIVASMFEYDGVPCGLDTTILERLLITRGKCGICKSDDSIIAVDGDYSGEITERYRGRDFTGAVPNKSFNEPVFEPENNQDGTCVVAWNNTNRSPDFIIYYIAEMLSETDISMKSNIRFARYNPLLRASDNKDKKMIEEVLKSNERGDLGIIVSNNFKADFEEKESINRIDLFDISKVDKLQYLSKFHEDLIARFLFHFGMDYSNGTKMAQQSVSEVVDGDKASMIYTLCNRLKCREKMVREVNQLFGCNMSVHLSRPWQVQLEEIENEPSIETSSETSSETSNESSNESASESASESAREGE